MFSSNDGRTAENPLRALSSLSFLKGSLMRPSAAASTPAAAMPAAPVAPSARHQGLRLLHRRFGVREIMARSTCVSQDIIPAVAYSTSETRKTRTLTEILSHAGKKAMGGGIPGMVAMVIQVFALMWMRTTINYQYRHGGTMFQTFRTLYAQGGIPRFYQGLVPALVQGPLSRFGDTAANTGMLALLDSYDATEKLPIGIKTLAASGAAAAFRIVLMPVDALKTTLQVEGAAGLGHLASKIRVGGPSVLWHGALAASGATFVGHYPWFATYNYLNELLPQYDDLARRLLRSALIGFVSSAISDTCSNSIRVIKTTKQTSVEPISYGRALTMVLAKDGVTGLLFRGLGTKIISNGLQGLMFSVLWRLGMDYWNKLEKQKAEDEKKKRGEA